MTLIFLRYPALWVLTVLSALLAVLSAKLPRGTAVTAVLAGLCAVGMVAAALACSVPYTEILLLLLAPVLACSAALWKEGRP